MRRSLNDVIRHQRVARKSEPTLKLLKEDSMEAAITTEFPDDRLKLLFVCAHPAFDPATGWRRVKPCDVDINAHRSTESQSVALRQPAQAEVPALLMFSGETRGGEVPSSAL